MKKLHKGIISALILVLPFWLWVFGAFGANYYADPNGSGTTCSEGSPCTLRYCIDTKASSGDTINLAAGTYKEATEEQPWMVFNLDPGISLKGPTVNYSYPTFTTEPTAIVTADTDSITGVSAWMIRGISADNTNGNQSIQYIKFLANSDAEDHLYGVTFGGRRNIEIKNCLFQDWNAVGLEVVGQASADCPGAPTTYAVGNSIHDTKFIDTGSTGGGGTKGAIHIGGWDGGAVYHNEIDNYATGVERQGIKYGCKGYLKNIDIYENTILTGYSNPGTGDWRFAIELWNIIDEVDVYKNDIQGTVNFDTSSFSDGTYALDIYNNYIYFNTGGDNPNTSTGIAFDDIVNGVKVRNNHIKGVRQGVEVVLNNSGGDQETEDVNGLYIYNNLFEDIGNSNGKALYISSSAATQDLNDIKFINNTIDDDGSNLQHVIKFWKVYDTDATGLEISNNIVTNTSAAYIEFNDGAGGASITGNVKSNNYYNSTALSNENNVATLTTSGNITTNPKFNADLTLKPDSPCIDAGIIPSGYESIFPLDPVNTTIDPWNPVLITRDYGQRDIGAFDAGVLKYDTEYAWRVDVNHAGGTETGTVYYFTTTSQANPPTPSGSGIMWQKHGAGIVYHKKGLEVQ